MAAPDKPAVSSTGSITKPQIFVAYAYALYPKKDFRKIFSELEKQYEVGFIFADEKITNQHILEKIISYMKGATFSIFDISGWNPNVTLELGLAYGFGFKWYLCLDPSKTQLSDVPSDLKGIDRIQYSSYTEFQEKLTLLLEQHFPKTSGAPPIDGYLRDLQDKIVLAVQKDPGISMSDIADLLSVSVEVARIAMRPLLGKKIRANGVKRGTKYSPL